MTIILDLSHHCIETASKREYERLVRQCFKCDDTDPDSSIIETHISALKYLLEKADFSDLRNQCSATGSVEKKAVLMVSKPFKDLYIRFNNATLYPVWKTR
ncbi:hypothetical protein [Desulfobacula sp.]|uniref:hypothetical protein n=1 Tax=Desulfobacula sp. TaxID=2593537 RepID=UPI00261B5F43|nr:hypothetical protein [Desulfobacula sp.]